MITTKNLRQRGLIGVFLLFTALFTVTSCKKDEIINSTSSKSTITTKSTLANEIQLPEIRNNRLYFPSIEALQNFTNSLNQFQDYDGLNNRFKEAGFISYYYFQNMDEDERKLIPFENKEFNDMPDDKLKTILSVNQEVQIDNVICRLQKDYGFIFEEKDRNLVSEFTQINPNFEGNETIYKKQIIAFRLSIKEHLDDGLIRKSISIGGYGWKTQNSYGRYGNNEYQVRGHHWATNVYFYKSMGVATYHEKWIKSGWWIFKTWGYKPWNAENVKLNVFGEATVKGYNVQGQQIMQTTIPYDKKYSINNTNKIVHDFDTRWQVGIVIGGGASMGVNNSFINISVPFQITGVNINHSLDIDWLTTDHEANNVKAASLKWKW